MQEKKYARNASYSDSILSFHLFFIIILLSNHHHFRPVTAVIFFTNMSRDGQDVSITLLRLVKCVS